MSDTNQHDRAAALALVKEYTTDPNLIRHMQSVEVAMRAYAVRFGGDPEVWGLVGLLHDFDYQRWPVLDGAGHPVIGVPNSPGTSGLADTINCTLNEAGAKPDNRVPLRVSSRR